MVETAVNPAHGAATGNALCTDAHARLADAGLRRLCMAAAQLAAEPDAYASRLFAVRPSLWSVIAVLLAFVKGSEHWVIQVMDVTECTFTDNASARMR